MPRRDRLNASGGARGARRYRGFALRARPRSYPAFEAARAARPEGSDGLYDSSATGPRLAGDLARVRVLAGRTAGGVAGRRARRPAAVAAAYPQGDLLGRDAPPHGPPHRLPAGAAPPGSGLRRRGRARRGPAGGRPRRRQGEVSRPQPAGAERLPRRAGTAGAAGVAGARGQRDPDPLQPGRAHLPLPEVPDPPRGRDRGDHPGQRLQRPHGRTARPPRRGQDRPERGEPALPARRQPRGAGGEGAGPAAAQQRHRARSRFDRRGLAPAG